MFGQYPAPRQTLVHISDTHFLGAGRDLYGRVDTDTRVSRALARIEASGIRPDALVFTGDIADLGEPDAYRRVRGIVEPVAERLGSKIVWVMGNHDERAPFRAELLGEVGSDTPDDAPVDGVLDLDGLRIITLDTSVPGWHHGSLTAGQRDWLTGVLAEPAEHGSLLVMHHPPIPTPLEVMEILELEDQHLLADVLRGTDVRGILAGHLHYSTTSMFAGIPVSVAAATCYTMELTAPRRELQGVDAGQSLTLVHVYDDRIVHSVIPIGDESADAPIVTRFDEEFLARLEAMSPADRREAFSRHRQTPGAPSAPAD